MEASEICKGCTTHQCCKNQPMHRRDFARIQKYLPKPVKINDIGNDFITFPYAQCPFLTDAGCIVPFEERPLNCCYFPFRFLKAKHGAFIQMLDVGFCPCWKEWGDHKAEALTFWKSHGGKEFR